MLPLVFCPDFEVMRLGFVQGNRISQKFWLVSFRADIFTWSSQAQQTHKRQTVRRLKEG